MGLVVPNTFSLFWMSNGPTRFIGSNWHGRYLFRSLRFPLFVDLQDYIIKREIYARIYIYIYIITMTTTLSCTRRRDGHFLREWFSAGKIFGHLESFYGGERYADEVRINYETHLQRKNHSTISMITLILCYSISIMSEIKYPKNP